MEKNQCVLDTVRLVHYISRRIHIRELDKQKFDELYEEIKAKNSELISEINQALLNGMTEETIQPLKEKDCSVQLNLDL